MKKLDSKIFPILSKMQEKNPLAFEAQIKHNMKKWQMTEHMAIACLESDLATTPDYVPEEDD